jgi:hypothetical protein
MMELYHPKDKRGKSVKCYRMGMSGSQTIKDAPVDDDKKKRRSSSKKNKSNKSVDVAAN